MPTNELTRAELSDGLQLIDKALAAAHAAISSVRNIVSAAGSSTLAPSLAVANLLTVAREVAKELRTPSDWGNHLTQRSEMRDLADRLEQAAAAVEKETRT